AGVPGRAARPGEGGHPGHRAARAGAERRGAAPPVAAVRGGAVLSGRLLSLNVGGPREVAWEGKTVRTAIWKDPVDGPRMARRVNIDGDDQADRAGHRG